MKRLYLEYAPDAKFRQYIEGLQQEILAVNNNAIAIASTELHITILHFGITERVYKEIRVAAPDLSWQKYVGLVELFAANTQAVLPQYCDVQPVKLAAYGRGETVAVLELIASKKLQAVQKACATELKQFLQACGIGSPQEFMKTNHNFHHVLDFKPHISLVRNAQVIPKLQLEQENLHGELVPLGYDLKHGRYT